MNNFNINQYEKIKANLWMAITMEMKEAEKQLRDQLNELEDMKITDIENQN